MTVVVGVTPWEDILRYFLLRTWFNEGAEGNMAPLPITATTS